MNPNLELQQDIGSALAPNVIASAATVRPVTAFSFITGTVRIATIVPPSLAAHMLVFVFTDPSPGQFLSSGNVQVDVFPVQDFALLLIFDPRTAKYYPASA
jgi:hypothetical protein